MRAGFREVFRGSIKARFRALFSNGENRRIRFLQNPIIKVPYKSESDKHKNHKPDYKFFFHHS